MSQCCRKQPLLLAFALVLSLCGVASGQSPTTRTCSRRTIWVSAIDRNWAQIPDLRVDEFAGKFHGKAGEILGVAPNNQRPRVAVLLDASGSVGKDSSQPEAWRLDWIWWRRALVGWSWRWSFSTTGGAVFGPVVQTTWGLARSGSAVNVDRKITMRAAVTNFYNTILHDYRLEIELPRMQDRWSQWKLNLTKPTRARLKYFQQGFARDIPPGGACDDLF